MELVDLDAVRTSQNNDSVPYANAAKRVIEWKREHGKMSQEAFAALADVSVGCLQALERNLRNTRRPNMEKIAKAMGLTYEELTAGDTEPVRADDPRVKDLLPDDLEVAHWYARADGQTKIQVRRILVDYYRQAREAEVQQKKEALRLPTEATFRDYESTTTERRSGVADRRQHTDRATDRERSHERRNG